MLYLAKGGVLIMPKDKKAIFGENMLRVISSLYDKSINGIPHVSKPVETIAQEYLAKYPDRQTAAKRMLNVQVAKCATSGFVTGFGGLITMPVTIPAELSSVLYVQMRMIACAAYIGGYNLDDDEVRTFVFACLAGVSVSEVAKKFGIKLGEKLAKQGIKKIPEKVLLNINQKVGFKLVTKFGEKGLINFGKMIPVVGAVINGGFDFGETRIIANRAYKMFIKNNAFSKNSQFVDAVFTDVYEDEDVSFEYDPKTDF